MRSYLPASGLAFTTAARSASEAGPMRPRGGAMKQRSTGSGTPLASRKESNASPPPNSTMAVAALNFFFGRKGSAAVFTAFLAFGGKARSACCALLLQGQQAALDRADALLADIAVLGGERAGILRRPLQHALQVLEIEQQQSLLVGDLEDDVQNAFLGVVELQQAGHQHRTDLGY